MKFSEWIEENLIRPSRLAKHLEISKSYLYFILNEKRKPSAELMEKIRILTKGKVRPKDFEDSKNIR